MLNSKNIISFFLLTSIFLLLSNSFNAQRYSDKGDRYFENNLFEEAIVYYEIELKKGTSDSKEYALKQLAESHRLSGNFEEAEIMYSKVLKKRKSKTIAENYLNYGHALKSSAKFEEAKVLYEEYIKMKPSDPLGPVYLNSCDSAQKWLDMGIGKTVTNIEALNTVASDFSPVILSNNQIVFTSSREGSKESFISFNGGMKINHLDLYSISLDSLMLSSNPKVSPIKELNTGLHEGPSCFSKDLKEVYITQTVKGIKNKKTGKTVNTLQILYRTFDDSLKTWSKPVSNCVFNSNSYSVAHPCLSLSEDTLFFVSNMKGGFGETDIYYAVKNEDGNWDTPLNMGNDVNTFGHELFPSMSSNGVLYFSSDGHPGMGQLDIFSTELDRGWWDTPKNLGTPINSIGNDFGITLDETNENGFFSSDRFNGVGKEDIYSFSFDAPFEIEISNDEIFFRDNFIFDGLKYKLIDLTDESEKELSNINPYLKGVIAQDTTYKLAIKKAFFEINTLNISYKFNKEVKYFQYDLNCSNKDIVINLKRIIEENNFLKSSTSKIVLIDTDGNDVKNELLNQIKEKIVITSGNQYILLLGEIDDTILTKVKSNIK
jgi:tetratricopeptide (TPR) repeat protein